MNNYELNKAIVKYDLDSDDGLMLYNEDTEETHVLNSTAIVIYDSIVANESVDSIVKKMMNDYKDVDIKKVKNDVIKIIECLVEKEVFVLNDVH